METVQESAGKAVAPGALPVPAARGGAVPASPLVGLFPGSLSVARFTFSGASLFERPPIPEGRLVFSLPDDWFRRWSVPSAPYAPPVPAPAVAARDIVVLRSAARSGAVLPPPAANAVAAQDIVVIAPRPRPAATVPQLPSPAVEPATLPAVPVFDDGVRAREAIPAVAPRAARTELRWLAATGLEVRMLPAPPSARGRLAVTADRLRRAVRSVGTAAAALQRAAPVLGRRLAVSALLPQTVRGFAAK